MSERARSSPSGLLHKLLFGSVKSAPPAAESLDRLHARLEAIERTLNSLSQMAHTPAVAPASDAIEQSLAALEKQIHRAGREQLKLNVLIETQNEQQRLALDALQSANEHRDNELYVLREQLRAARQDARLDMVQALLPVLDGLSEAQRAGTHLLAQPSVPSQRRGLFARQRQEPPSAAEQLLRESMGAWLEGLRFVRQRLLDLLAAEGVVPIDADGQPFDPHRHIVFDVVAATEQPPGTVVTTLRQGYIGRDHVVRLAEVVVAGAPASHNASRDGQTERKQ